MQWTHGIGLALGIALGPYIAKIWRKIDAYDERRIAEYEARQATKRQHKAARKAAKNAAGGK